MKTDYVDLLVLLFGLTPLMFVCAKVWKNGLNEIATLRSFAVIVIWIGYDLSPWLYFFTKELWDFFLLVPEEINTGIKFSTLSSLLFVFGHGLVYSDKINRKKIIIKGYYINRKYLLLLIMVVLLSVVVINGGIGEVIYSSKYRGYGQFDGRDFYGKIKRVLTVMQLPLVIFVSILSSLIVIGCKKRLYNIFLSTFGLMAASLQGMHGFSRGAGLPFILLGIICAKFSGKNKIFLALFSFFIAYYIGAVGLSQREHYYPGIGNYFHAFINYTNGLVVDNRENADRSNQWENPLDALAPFTRKASSVKSFQSNFFTFAPKLIWNLNPIPSEFIPIYPIGEGLSSMMHTEGFLGITTPAFAELYYVFGYAGVIFLLLIGLMCGYFEKISALDPSKTNVLLVILNYTSFPLGLHSSMRAMTRPMVYSMILLIFISVYNNKIKMKLFGKVKNQFKANLKNRIRFVNEI